MVRAPQSRTVSNVSRMLPITRITSSPSRVPTACTIAALPSRTLALSDAPRKSTTSQTVGSSGPPAALIAARFSAATAGSDSLRDSGFWSPAAPLVQIATTSSPNACSMCRDVAPGKSALIWFRMKKKTACIA